ncbi:MAG: hypothetical protein LBT05_11185 [Planctomycetaceae bacterium]|nr:hypothetical protein [Planctomycetaceae bacterium]
MKAMTSGNISYTFAAAAAGTHLSERQTENAEKQTRAANQERVRDSVERAEKAAEAGAVRDDSAETSDRDADGRQAWRRVRKGQKTPVSEREQSKDTTGKIGKTLDVSG